MNRISQTFAALKAQNRSAFVPFITAGDPDFETALALLTAPAYWAVWRKPLVAGFAGARRMLTTLLAAIVWWNFLVGHMINYISGLFS